MWASIIAIVIGIWNTIATVGLLLWHVVRAVWTFVEPALVPLEKFGKAVWNDFLMPLWRDLKTLYTKINGWFDRYLGPVKDWIKAIYDAERQLYCVFFQPLLDIITRLRQFLAISGLTHTALGQAIERELGLLYGAVNTVYQSITQPLNEIIGTIETYILDAQQLLAAPLLLASTLRSIKGIFAQLLLSGRQLLHPDIRSVLKRQGTPRKVADIHQHTQTYLRSRGGDYAPQIDAALVVFRHVTLLEQPPTWPPAEPPAIP